jgi:hypothetical protein
MAAIPYASVIESPFSKDMESPSQSFPATQPMTPAKTQVLKSMGLPSGLIDCLANAHAATARRYWIVDNSGSMSIQDGNRVLSNNKLVSCSRWQELGDTLRWQGQVASTLGAHTEFRMLNEWINHTNTLRQHHVVVGAPGGDDNDALNQLNAAIASTPAKGTPLCAALREVVSEIQALAPELRAAGKSVSVIIASDGEASDGDMNTVKATLAPLANLPCDVVIRLCTDEVHVVNYWNDIDNDLELDLDVLDDTAGEGVEVRELNPWIGYGEALHRVREFGAAPKVFDLIDEKKLAITESADFIRHVIGDGAVDLPDPQVSVP